MIFPRKMDTQLGHHQFSKGGVSMGRKHARWLPCARCGHSAPAIVAGVNTTLEVSRARPVVQA